ncbi:hypothetical protein B484DRAFT_406240 [Ochromonadaceae sp. CCMP2298]|nr:hypothetical protein B484DRAFT_406240 [Ochromonadaceae sp. CCMP2298]
MGRSNNTGLTEDKKGRRGAKTPTGSRKVAKLSPPDSSIISSITPTDITADLSSATKRSYVCSGHINLHERVQAVGAVLRDLQHRYGLGGSMNRITAFTEDSVAPMLGTSGKRIFNRVAGQPEVVNVGVFDNSSGHNLKAKDGLDTGKLNLGPGGAADKVLVIRDGVYLCAQRGVIVQPFFFQLGDVLLIEVKCGSKIRPRSTHVIAKTTRCYPVGSIIDEDCELLEVAKGMKQVLLERGVQFGGTCLQESGSAGA